MKTQKIIYEKPYSKVLNYELQGIVCQSNLEPIEEGDDHEW
jgi:hypothetical protein